MPTVAYFLGTLRSAFLPLSNFRAKKSTKKCNWAKKVSVKYHFLVIKKAKYLKTLTSYFGMAFALYRGMKRTKKWNKKIENVFVNVCGTIFALTFLAFILFSIGV